MVSGDGGPRISVEIRHGGHFDGGNAQTLRRWLRCAQESEWALVYLKYSNKLYRPCPVATAPSSWWPDDVGSYIILVRGVVFEFRLVSVVWTRNSAPNSVENSRQQ